MKFLIILLAMAATVGGALHSWHSRTLYVRAALFSEGFGLAAPAKLRVADHYVRHGVLPHDNAEAGLPPPRSLYGTSVRRVAVNRGGVLVVDFDDEIGRESMTFTPSVSPVSGLLDWRCTSDSIEPAVLERLRPACDPLPATLESRLMHAIANRAGARVGELLAAGARPDAVVHGNTPLMLAAEVGDTAVVEALLEAGAPVDNAVLGAERRTPLMVAIASDRADVADVLLAHGASVTRTDHRELTALDHAVATDRRLGGERYVRLVSARFSPRFAGAPTGRGPLSPAEAARAAAAREARLVALHGEFRAAARDCHVQRLASLLREEDDLAAPELVAGEPLLARTRRPACRARLAAHLPTKASYREARAARLAAAVAACDARQVEAMLGADADLGVLEGTGGRPAPFDQAIGGGCTDVAGLMIRARRLEGRLADDVLLRAIRRAPPRALVPLVGALLAAGANVDARDADGHTPLEEAIARERPVIAKYLVDAGADVDAPTAGGSRPIVEASKKGYGHLVAQLLDGGADIESRDVHGRTALLAAVAGGHGRLVDTLVRAGADVRRRDENGIDAVLLAESRELRRIRSLLVAAADEGGLTRGSRYP